VIDLRATTLVQNYPVGMMPEAISGFFFDDFSIEEKIPKRSPIQRAASFFFNF
jgi:hypothetical protein